MGELRNLVRESRLAGALVFAVFAAADFRGPATTSPGIGLRRSPRLGGAGDGGGSGALLCARA